MSLFDPPRDRMSFMLKCEGVFRKNCAMTAFEQFPRLTAWMNKCSISLCFSASSEDSLLHAFIIVPNV